LINYCSICDQFNKFRQYKALIDRWHIVYWIKSAFSLSVGGCDKYFSQRRVNSQFGRL